MGFEIPIDVDYWDHPKTKLLIEAVSPEADTYPLRLWKWAAKYCRSGILGPTPAGVEAVIGWTGKGRTRGRLVLELIRCGFIDLQLPDGAVLEEMEAHRKTQECGFPGPFPTSPGTYVIHGWEERIGHAILIYERKKQKQREEYARKAGILPEERGKYSPYPGDPGNPGNPGGDTASPSSPSAGTPEAPVGTGGQPAQTEATWGRIIKLYRDWDPTVPVEKCQKEVARAERLGISPERLLADVERLKVRLKLWSIVDLYEHPASRHNNGNGQTRENATAYLKVPGPTQAEKEAERKKRDEAIAKADQILEEMDPDERDGWRIDAEAEAEKAKVPNGPARDGFIKSKLRSRAAKAFSIEGV